MYYTQTALRGLNNRLAGYELEEWVKELLMGIGIGFGIIAVPIAAYCFLWLFIAVGTVYFPPI